MKQAEYIKAASSTLVRMMQTTDKDEWFNCENMIKTYEVQADALLTEIYEDLYGSLMAPVSRTDPFCFISRKGLTRILRIWQLI